MPLSEKQKSIIIIFFKVLEILLLPLTIITSLWSKAIALVGYHNLPVANYFADLCGFRTIDDHFNMPMIRPKRNLVKDLNEARDLSGIDWNVNAQLALLSKFNYQAEISKFPIKKEKELGYYFDNPMFSTGDAEYLYSIIRHFKPQKMIEIGSGFSTLIGLEAFEMNKKNDATRAFEMISIEPYANPWLEKTKSTIVRERVELIDKTIFKQLKTNDILFIDSSHMIRPQGDVVVEILEILPILEKGVIVHIHDIFSPCDYPDYWIIDRGRLWNEQYMVEAFLSCNPHFEVIGALNFLSKNHAADFSKAMPVYANHKFEQPRSLWLRKIT